MADTANTNAPAPRPRHSAVPRPEDAAGKTADSAGGSGGRIRRTGRMLVSAFLTDVRKAREARKAFHEHPGPDHPQGGDAGGYAPWVQHSAKVLRRDGFAVVHDAFDAATCDALAELARRLHDGIETTTSLPSGTQVIVRGSQQERDYDTGFIDIYDVDKEDQRARLLALDAHVREAIRRSWGREPIERRTSIYVSRGVTDTRTYHRDSVTQRSFKVFLYLTDVTEPADGPYAFVRGTHRHHEGKYRSLVRAGLGLARHPGGASAAALDWFPPRAQDDPGTPCYGTKGTLILSDQNGLHRGWPQAPGRARYVLVTTFGLGADAPADQS